MQTPSVMATACLSTSMCVPLLSSALQSGLVRGAVELRQATHHGAIYSCG